MTPFPLCYDCKHLITGEVVWLQHDGEGDKYPMHPTCADQPWPLSVCDPPSNAQVAQ